MSSVAPVSIHASQFPENVRRALLGSLERRQINHKFHYDSLKQSQKWLALHQAYSPARNDVDCVATYDRAFGAVAGRFASGRVSLVGLGCGGGQKDVRLLELLARNHNQLFYTATDVSLPLVLTAREAAMAVIPESHCSALVCDLATAEDLPEILQRTQGPTLFTFFGMLPNFEPDEILPRLARLIRPGDWLLVSANLAPGSDYAAGLGQILPQYDNELTRDWLVTFLLDLGVEKTDGQLRFSVEDVPVGSNALKRVVAYFQFGSTREIRIGEHQFEFRPGETIRMFFSYRYTPALVRTLLEQHGLAVVDEWLTASGEEGVFLAKRS